MANGKTFTRQQIKDQNYLPTGFTFDTDDGLHAEANKGELDGIVRIAVSMKGSHGERGFWRSGTVESWHKFLQAVPDIEAAINSYVETSAALKEIEAHNAIRQEKLSKLEGSREFMTPDAFKAALAKLDADYPKRSVEDLKKKPAPVAPTGEDVEPNVDEDSEA